MLALVFVLLPLPGAAAQDDARVAYRGPDGRWVMLDRSEWPPMPRRKKGVPDRLNAFFRDVLDETGIGFDDPTEGETRRQTAMAVMQYVGGLLDVIGTADIEFQQSVEGGAFLAAASPLLDLPAPDGIYNGFVFDHLTTGTDPDPELPDGAIIVNFAFDWNSDLGDPVPEEYDLFSILLHELTHALGMVSLMDETGQSQLSEEPRATGIFTHFDEFLERGISGKKLVLDGGVVNATTDDLISQDVVFVGAQASVAFAGSVPIHSPSIYAPGSSLSHWGFPISFEAVMFWTGPPGVTQRDYLPYEVQALADLGYGVFTCGDEAIEGGEQCDDGNTETDDGCSLGCSVEAGWICSGEPSACEAERCGDGVAVDEETCDDGGTSPGDGCNASCTLEPGWACEGTPSVCEAAECGDGFIVGDEECDDDNGVIGDGCDIGCVVDPGWTCTGEPSVCTRRSGGGGGGSTDGGGNGGGNGGGANLNSNGGGCTLTAHRNGNGCQILLMVGSVFAILRRRQRRGG